MPIKLFPYFQPFLSLILFEKSRFCTIRSFCVYKCFCYSFNIIRLFIIVSRSLHINVCYLHRAVLFRSSFFSRCVDGKQLSSNNKCFHLSYNIVKKIIHYNLCSIYFCQFMCIRAVQTVLHCIILGKCVTFFSPYLYLLLAHCRNNKILLNRTVQNEHKFFFYLSYNNNNSSTKNNNK